MASALHRKTVKVVLIDTQYVVTDPTSFKSVVQNLTGKDSCVSWIEESSFCNAKKKRRGGDRPPRNVDGACNNVTDNSFMSADCRSFSKALSFKEFDRMLVDMPPAEEWQQFLSQQNLL